MPYEGVAPWRWQYFAPVACPDRVVIPIDDPTAWRLYPAYRDTLSKLFICESQGIANGPHGLTPASFPVFSKPATNLHGMGSAVGGSVQGRLEAHFTPGHMWMALLTGRQVSTDVALVRGRPRWWRHTTGKALPRACSTSRRSMPARARVWSATSAAGSAGICAGSPGS
jgi:hypothetical protein